MKGSVVPREYGRRPAMRWRAETILPGLVGLLGILSPGPAFAAERTCSSPIVEADAIVRGRWPELPEQVREVLDGRGDLDVCARVRVRSVDGSITVEVVLPDGRFASRPIKRSEDLVPTIEALLLLPRAPDPSLASPPESRSVAAAQTTPVIDVRKDGIPHDITARASPPPFGAPPSRLGIELSIALGAHFGDGQKSAGVGAISLLDLGGWLVGFEGRVDRYDGTSTAPAPMDALEVGVLGGRRFRFRSLAFDLVAGPAMALRGGSERVTMQVASGMMVNTVMQSSSVEALVPRLRLGSRLTFRARSLVRAFVGVDGEVGDVGPIGHGPLGETQDLPVWTVGLTVGATVGTL
jgi:hypothetical protein